MWCSGFPYLVVRDQRNSYGTFIPRAVHSAACTALWPQARHISPESAVLVNKGGTMFQDTDMLPFAILPRRLAVGILKETWLTVTDWKTLLDAALKAVVFQI
ncbi:hypothetical protein B0H10DRAFT_1971805 [Mycena sp. CBHHK59/15]|nr:hypothetical protein B0H10DRAFT_1971805 [Mycena sp. CBHHK59/15]